MKKLILICGLLIGMISCLENEEPFEAQSINYLDDSFLYQKETTAPGDTISIDSPVGTDEEDEDDDPPPASIGNNTKKEKQNDSLIVILP